MRNNPVHNESKKQTVQYKQIEEYVRFEKFKRYFEVKRPALIRFFTEVTKATHDLAVTQQGMKDFFKAVDVKIKLNNALADFIHNSKTIQKLKTNITFDTVLTELIKFCSLQQAALTTDHFDILFS